MVSPDRQCQSDIYGRLRNMKAPPIHKYDGCSGEHEAEPHVFAPSTRKWDNATQKNCNGASDGWTNAIWSQFIHYYTQLTLHFISLHFQLTVQPTCSLTLFQLHFSSSKLWLISLHTSAQLNAFVHHYTHLSRSIKSYFNPLQLQLKPITSVKRHHRVFSPFQIRSSHPSISSTLSLFIASQGSIRYTCQLKPARVFSPFQIHFGSSVAHQALISLTTSCTTAFWTRIDQP